MGIGAASRQTGFVSIVDITGKIVLGEDIGSVRNLIIDLLRNGDKQILLNLRDVDHMDSSGLGFLVGTFTTVRRQHGELKLLHPSKKVQDAMRFTKLSAIFEIFDEEAEAVRSFRLLPPT